MAVPLSMVFYRFSYDFPLIFQWFVAHGNPSTHPGLAGQHLPPPPLRGPRLRCAASAPAAARRPGGGAGSGTARGVRAMEAVGAGWWGSRGTPGYGNYMEKLGIVSIVSIISIVAIWKYGYYIWLLVTGTSAIFVPYLGNGIMNHPN